MLFFLKTSLCTNFVLPKKLLLVEDFIKEVIHRNPDLPVIRARLKEAELAIARVQTFDDPVIAITTMNNPFAHQTVLMPREVSVEVSQKFPFPGKLWVKGKIQAQKAEWLWYEEIITRIDLIFQAKKLFFTYCLNKVALEINKENTILVQRIIDDALAVYKSGKGKIEDVLKGEVALQKLEEEYLVLKSEKETIKAFVNALRNVPQSTQVPEPLIKFYQSIPFNYSLLESIALQERPELKGINAKITEENFQASLAQRDYFPDFEISAMVQRFKDPKKDQSEFAWGVNVGLNVPLWIPRKQRREYLEAQERVVATKHQFVGLTNIIKARVKEIIEKIKTIEERIILNDEIIKKTTKTLFANEFSYRTGTENFLTLLDTQRELQNFLFMYEKTKIEKEMLLAELERELGIPIEKIFQHSYMQSHCFPQIICKGDST